MPPEREPTDNGFKACGWAPPGRVETVAIPDSRNFRVASFDARDLLGEGGDLIFGLRIGRRGSADPWGVVGGRFNVPAQQCFTGIQPLIPANTGCAFNGDSSANALWSIDFSLDFGGRTIGEVEKDHAVELRIRGGTNLVLPLPLRHCACDGFRAKLTLPCRPVARSRVARCPHVTFGTHRVFIGYPPQHA